MESDFDKKLYNDYLNGKQESFETLYLKYKNKINYFIFNIIRDYDKAEDVTQDVFVYILKNKFRTDKSFKYYLYLVAKSKAIDYLNKEKRRKDISEKYLDNIESKNEKDALDTILKIEEKNSILEGISMLDEKYRYVMFLNKIEEFSYEETADILNISLQDVKNSIHRGKKQLKKIMIKKGFEDMNKISKIILILIISTIVLSGVTLAVNQIYKLFNTNHNITFEASYESTLDENTINNLWVGTLDLAWKDLMEKIGGKIELDENIKIANELNNSTFTKEMLDSNDYQINVERTFTNGYKIDATLDKKLNFLEVFDNFSYDYSWTFGDNKDEYIKYFGINNASSENMNKNIEILFYNRTGGDLIDNDFAVKLNTKEGDEIILYRTDENKSFDEYYNDIKEKSNQYTGSSEFGEDDQIVIPYVRVTGLINYNELYGKKIKNSDGLYIYDVIQNVNFSLNEKGCNLDSQATMVTEYLSIGQDTKFCYFKDTFIIFLKENNSDKPYFALKVDNTDILEKKEETDEPKILDFTMMADSDRYEVAEGEYMFFEDDKYEYYYPTKKTRYVRVYFKTGGSDTVEWALKQGKITMDLVDKYGVEYFKKEK